MKIEQHEIENDFRRNFYYCYEMQFAKNIIFFNAETAIMIGFVFVSFPRKANDNFYDCTNPFGDEEICYD